MLSAGATWPAHSESSATAPPSATTGPSGSGTRSRQSRARYDRARSVVRIWPANSRSADSVLSDAETRPGGPAHRSPMLSRFYAPKSGKWPPGRHPRNVAYKSLSAKGRISQKRDSYAAVLVRCDRCRSLAFIRRRLVAHRAHRCARLGRSFPQSGHVLSAFAFPRRPSVRSSARWDEHNPHVTGSAVSSASGTDSPQHSHGGPSLRQRFHLRSGIPQCLHRQAVLPALTSCARVMPTGASGPSAGIRDPQPGHRPRRASTTGNRDTRCCVRPSELTLDIATILFVSEGTQVAQIVRKRPTPSPRTLRYPLRTHPRRPFSGGFA